MISMNKWNSINLFYLFYYFFKLTVNLKKSNYPQNDVVFASSSNKICFKLYKEIANTEGQRSLSWASINYISSS